MSTQEVARAGTVAPTRRWPPAAVVLGALVMLVGAGTAAPLSVDPEYRCGMYGPCPDPVTDPVAPWLIAAAGFATALAGLVALCARHRTATDDFPTVPLAVRASGAGLAGGVAFAALSPAVLSMSFGGLLGILVAICLAWLTQIGVLTIGDRAFEPAGPRPRSVAPDLPFVALVALAAAGAVGIEAIDIDGLDLSDVALAAAVHGSCTTLGLLIARGRRLTGPARTAAVAVAAVAMGVLVTSTVVATDTGRPERVYPPPAAAPEWSPPPIAAPFPTDPAPTPAPAAPVEASVACEVDDLTWSTAGWDAALGARFVSVVARNTGTEACSVEGVPRIRMTQGGVPLPLTIDLSRGYDPYLEVADGPVGIAPGGAASFGLRWRVNAGADEDTPQTLSVALPPADVWADVAFDDSRPAPFDVTAGTDVAVGGWRPES